MEEREERCKCQGAEVTMWLTSDPGHLASRSKLCHLEQATVSHCALGVSSVKGEQ